MEQTNRTILFEELNSRKEGLLSMVGSSMQRESLTDEETDKIRESLVVKSFEEAVVKFEPAVYMHLDTDNRTVEFVRTDLDRDGRFCPVLLGTEGTFFEALLDFMEQKREGNYVLDSFENHLDNMLFSREPEGFLEERSALRKAVCRKQYQKADRILHKIILEYDDGVFLIKTFLQQVSASIRDAAQNEPDRRFVLGQEGECEVYPLEISDRFPNRDCHSLEEDQEYRIYLQEQWKSAALANKTLLLLLLDLACPMVGSNEEWMINYYHSYLDFYQIMVEKFWWAAMPVYETLLGIKSFFDQYTLPEGSMKPELLITNCRIADIAGERGQKILRLYLESVNNKNEGKETIWYAVLPGVAYAGKKKKPVRERFLGTAWEQEYRGTEPEDIYRLSEMLGEYRIFSFLSARPVRESTFRGFRKEGILPWQETFRFLAAVEKKEYIIPCYPNFTIMPDMYSMIVLGYENTCHPVNGKREKGKAKKSRLGDLNVEASYVAAGLTAACQCPDYLKKHYFKSGYLDSGEIQKGVQKGMPGISYHLCAEGHNRVTVTQMFSETTVFPKELFEEIDRNSHGMVFVPFHGRVAARTDRVFSYRPGAQDDIAAQQTLIYMERKIRHETQDFKKPLVEAFFEERPGSTIAEWKAAPDCVNGILKRGEEIRCLISEKENVCRIEIRFLNGKKDFNRKMNQ